MVLSPGTHSETAYDQSFLASLLGFPLAEADDLTLRDGRVWLRAAKAGELLERFDTVHLVRAGELVAGVPSYRGEGRNFG